MATHSSHKRYKSNSKGQVELVFNWMYILIAGGVILLFFVGIVMRQKDISEQQLGDQVIHILQSIFTGSGVSENTKNFIDTSGLQHYEFEFSCTDGVSRFGIVGQGGTVEDTVQPIFSPERLQTPRLILWSLPYKLPYKVTDFLFVTSQNTQYAIFGDDEFAAEFVKATGGDSSKPVDPAASPAPASSSSNSNKELSFNVKSYDDDQYEDIDIGKQYQIRIVDIGGLQISPDKEVPISLKNTPDIKATAVVISADHSTATFYRKRANLWKQWSDPIPIISITPDDEKDAAAYAAIFAGSPELYICNMQKAFARIPYVTKIYAGENIASAQPGGKLNMLIGSYPDLSECRNAYTKSDPNIIQTLQTHFIASLACIQEIKATSTIGSCTTLIQTASELNTMNSDTLVSQGCTTLY